MFNDLTNIYEKEYSSEVLFGKEAFECIKSIGLVLISNGYPSELISSKLLSNFGQKLSEKYDNFEFNDDFVYYEILLDGLKNNSETKLMRQCDEIWGINLILKLCQKYNLSSNEIDPIVIDRWLYNHGYNNDKVKTEKFLKALSEMLITPDEYLCGREITSYFTKKYDISSAIKHAMDDNKPVYLEEYAKSKFSSAKKVSISSIDAYDKIINMYSSKFGDKKIVDDVEIFEFINCIPNILKSEGIPSSLIRELKIKEIEPRLAEKFNNFKLNEKNFELYLSILNNANINELLNKCTSVADIYNILYYSSKLNKKVDNIDFSYVLNNCKDIIELVNFLQVSKNYLSLFDNLTPENIDSWLNVNNYYELPKFTESILYLYNELPKYVTSVNYFYDKYDIDSATTDYNSGNIKPMSTYDKTNNIEYNDEEELNNDVDVLTIESRRKTTKSEKRETLIIGSGIISFLMVSFVTKKNPVQVAHNFQQITTASDMSDKIGDFSKYITSIVHSYTDMVGATKIVDERRRVR